MTTPDIRWKHRYRKAMDAVAELRETLIALMELDTDNDDATWQDDAKTARWCVEGIDRLLINGNAERATALEKLGKAKS